MSTFITIERISAIIAILIVVVAGLAVAQSFFAGRTGEQFSELGILGPSMKIGDYPMDVVAGQSIRLYAYVGNHMERPVWYTVQVKMGDNSTTVDPASSQPIFSMDTVLAENATVTLPVDFTIAKPGLNQRLIFELWAFNETANVTYYTGRWGQLWINVTQAPV